jgi:hypothetical protein
MGRFEHRLLESILRKLLLILLDIIMILWLCRKMPISQRYFPGIIMDQVSL